MSKKEATTGRSWKCPRCEFVIYEGIVEYSEASCSRTLKCKHGGGATAMKLVEPVVQS